MRFTVAIFFIFPMNKTSMVDVLHLGGFSSEIAMTICGIIVAAYFLCECCTRRNKWDWTKYKVNKKTVAKYLKGKYFVTSFVITRPILLAEEGIASEKPITVQQMLSLSAKNKGTTVALRDSRGKTWTYNEYQNDIFRFANSLRKLNLSNESSVNICGFNSP